jgi:hypothetical protein
MFEWKPYGNLDGNSNFASYTRILLCAEIYSKNGAWGECFIWQDGESKKFYLTAGGMDTGREWKSPEEEYTTIEEAKAAAERIWQPVLHQEPVKYVGRIPVFPLAQHNPNDSGDCKDPENVYVVYCGDGSKLYCYWKDSAFWKVRGGIEVVMGVEFWFRIPEVEEIVHV